MALKGRGLLRDVVILLIGAVGGYTYARHGRGIGRTLPDPAQLPHRFQWYYRTHPNETIVGAILLAIIVYLAFGKRGGGAPKAKR